VTAVAGGGPRYPLAVVLALRAREEGAARLGVARALAEVDRRRGACDAAARAAEEGRARAARAGALPRSFPVTAGELDARSRRAGRLRREAAALAAQASRARTAVAEAEAGLAAAEQGLVLARGRVRALERHRERWVGEARRAGARRAEAVEEDAISARRAAP
jgi:hypothetical protein